VTANISERIGLFILAWLFLTTLPFAFGSYRFFVREVVILGRGTIELHTDFRLFQTCKSIGLEQIENVDQESIYIPRIGTIHKIFIGHSAAQETIEFGENLSEEEAAYIVKTINAHRRL